MIELFFTQTAWRLRAYLPPVSGPDDLTEEAFFRDLRIAEHQAAQYQLPMLAASRYTHCAFTDPAGNPCQAQAITEPLYGFLCRNPGAPVIHRLACRFFVGALCEQHLAHLVVPPQYWWPSEDGEHAREGVPV